MTCVQDIDRNPLGRDTHSLVSSRHRFVSSRRRLRGFVKAAITLSSQKKFIAQVMNVQARSSLHSDHTACDTAGRTYEGPLFEMDQNVEQLRMVGKQGQPGLAV